MNHSEIWLSVDLVDREKAAALHLFFKATCSMIVLKRFVRLRVKIPTRANVYTVSRLVLILVRTLGSCFLYTKGAYLGFT